MTRPRIVIVIEGGLIQNIVCDQPVDALILDYDTEDSAASEVVELPDVSDAGKELAMSAAAHFGLYQVEINPAYTATRFEQLARVEGGLL